MDDVRALEPRRQTTARFRRLGLWGGSVVASSTAAAARMQARASRSYSQSAMGIIATVARIGVTLIRRGSGTVHLLRLHFRRRLGHPADKAEQLGQGVAG
jgi:hypothetical protein